VETAIVGAIPAIILAMGGILKLVLNAMERIEERQEKFLGNHLSQNTAAMKALTESIVRHESKSQLELLRLRTALEKSGIAVPHGEADEGG
jgi:hypothetical protein